MRTNHKFQPRRHGIAIALSACFSTSAVALPVDPTVTNGSASFQQNGGVLTVTNSNGAIIDWKDFSIGRGETTHFLQESASSSVLNRVLVGDPSLIYGTLSSNGQVALVNPAGIYVGSSGRVDAAGFTASTLKLSDQDFLAGRLVFQSDVVGGAVENRGVISVDDGGSVYLVGSRVANHGAIVAPHGDVILAAGATVSLVNTGTPGVSVELSGTTGQVSNLGRIHAAGGQIGLSAALVENSGRLNASSVVSDGGRIWLRATKDVSSNGQILANGVNGGVVQLESEGTTRVSGSISAVGRSGQGGQIEVLGDKVGVFTGAELDASGETGGGVILVGGDFRGENPDVQNAEVTWVGTETVLRANALADGDGGKVIVWADDTTRAFGHIEAKGGAEGGDGGFVEVSGKNYLDFRSSVDTTAPRGNDGELLLDPGSITVFYLPVAANEILAGGSFDAGGVFSGGSGPATLYWTVTPNNLSGLLATTNVTLTTDTSTGDGSILFDGGTSGADFVNSTTPNTLRLLARGGGTGFGNVTLNNARIELPIGAVEIYAGWDGNVATPGLVGTSGAITLLGGSTGPSGIRAKTAKLYAADYVSMSGFGLYGAFIETIAGDLDLRAQRLTMYGAMSALGQGESFIKTAGGNQTFTLGRDGDGVDVAGGGVYLSGTIATSGSYYGSEAGIFQTGAGAQTFNIYGTSSLVQLTGSSSANGTGECYNGGPTTCSRNGAIIESSGDGGQFFYFRTPGGVMNLTAGSNGNGNAAEIHYGGTGSQVIQGMSGATVDASFGPTISLNGGSTGGLASYFNAGKWHSIANEALISADSSSVSQVIKATNIALNGNGSTGSFGGAFLVAPIQDISVYGGDLTLNGGGSDQLYQVNAGAWLPSSAAVVGWDADSSVTVSLHDAGGSGGNLMLYAGTGPSGNAMMGSTQKANVTVNAYGAVLMSTPGSGGIARMGSLGEVVGSSVTLNADIGNCPICDENHGILLDGDVFVGASDAVTLSSLAGGISQSTGAIRAGTLSATADGAISFLGNNLVSTITNLYSTNGDIDFNSVFTGITHFDSVSAGGTNVSLSAPSGSIGHGLVESRSAGSGYVIISADGKILDDNGDGVANIRAGGGSIVDVSSVNGDVGALAISTDIDLGSGSMFSGSVGVGAPYGGIRVHNVGSAELMYLSLSDQSAQSTAMVSYETAYAVNLGGLHQLTSSAGGIGVIASDISFSAPVTVSGPIVLSSSGPLSVGSTYPISSAADVSLTGVDVTIGGNVSSSAGTVSVTGDRVAVTAATVVGNAGVKVTSADYIRLDGATVASNGGDIQLLAGGNIALINSSLVDTTSGTGNVDLVAGGNVDVSSGNSVKSGGAATLDATGTLMVAATSVATGAADVTLAGSAIDINGTVGSSGGAVSATSASYINLDGGSVTSLSGGIQLLAGTNISLINSSLVDTSSGLGALRLVAGGDINFASSSVASGAGLVLNATGVLTLAGASASAVGSIASFGASANFSSATVASSGGAVSFTGGRVNLTGGTVSGSTGVTVTSTDSVSLDAGTVSSNGGDVQVAASGSVGLINSSLVDTTGGSGMIRLAAGGNMDVSSGSSVKSGASVVMNAVGTLNVAATSLISGVSDVSLTGPSNTLASRPVIGINGTVSSSTAGVMVEGRQVALTGGTLSGNTDIAVDGTEYVRLDGGMISSTSGAVTVRSLGNIELMNASGIDNSTGLGHVRLAAGRDIKLNGGSYIRAGDDVMLDLASAQSTLYLNESPTDPLPSYVLSDIGTRVAATTYLRFALRSSGGVVIDGVPTLTTLPGKSGFFAVNDASPFVPQVSHAVVTGDTFSKEVGSFFDDFLRVGEKVGDRAPENVEALYRKYDRKKKGDKDDVGSDANSKGLKDDKDRSKPGRCV